MKNYYWRPSKKMSRSKQKRKLKPRILFFVEGETEEAFFDSLSQNYGMSAAKTIKILNNSGGDWIDKAKNMMANNTKLKPDSKTKVFIIFDKNNNTEKEINEMFKKAKKLKLNNATCKIGFSNSSFEVWLLAHYQKITSTIISQKDLYVALTKYLNQKYVKANRRQIENILKDDKVCTAIENTKNVSTVSVSKQSTNIGNIVTEVISSNQ